MMCCLSGRIWKALHLNGDRECNNVERPYGAAKESVIICTLQAKPVISVLLSRNILKDGNSMSRFCYPHQVLR